MKNNQIDLNKKIMFSAICNIILFCCFIQSDIVITARHGMNIWESIVQGEILSFYTFNLDASVKGNIMVQDAAIYDFFLYVVFAIWNLPLWILEHFFEINVFDGPFGLLWIKSILIPFVILLCYALNDICRILGVEKDAGKKTIALILASPVFMFSISIMGQYDIIAISIILLAIRSYMIGNIKQFIFWMSIAMPFKWFAIFFEIPLLLIKEKRIRYLVLEVIASCWLVILPRLIFESEISQAGGQGRFINYILDNKLPVFYDGICIFFVFLVIWYIILYFHKPINFDNIDKKNIIYICFFSIAMLIVLCCTHPQWALLLIPFMCLSVYCTPIYEKQMALLSVLATVGILIAQIVKYFWCFATDLINPMVLSLIKTLNEDHAINSAMEKVGIPTNIVYEMGGAVFVASILCFSVLIFLSRKKKMELANVNYWYFVIIGEWFSISIYGILLITFILG